MITKFFDEYFFHPASLEYSCFGCGYNCSYCFAKRTSKSLHGDIKQAVNFLQHKGKSQAYKIYKKGYPICLSNRTDPFSPPNIKSTEIFCNVLANENDNQIFFQTKGGDLPRIERILDSLRNENKGIIYITITSLNSLSKFEPNAPNLENRLNLIEIAKGKGWGVAIGINPMSEQIAGLREYEELIDICEQRGADFFLAAGLYFGKFKEKLTEEEKSKFTSFPNRREAQKLSDSILNILQKNHKNICGTSDDYIPLLNFYQKHFRKHTPLYSSFLNFCDKNLKSGERIYMDDWEYSMLERCGDIADFDINSTEFIFQEDWNKWKIDSEAKNLRTLRELVLYLWKKNTFQFSATTNNFTENRNGELFYKP